MKKEEIRLWINAIYSLTEGAFKKRDKKEFEFYREWLWELIERLEKREHRDGRPTLKELCYVFEVLQEHLDSMKRGELPSYRHLLYSGFGLGAASYAPLMLAGALDVHNAFVDAAEKFRAEGLVRLMKQPRGL